MAGDLHTHSIFSDASGDIAWLPKLAQRAGLTHLAVTDHDTARAAQYAWEHPVENKVRLIPGVELSAWDAARERKVHILCYYPALTPALLRHFDRMAARRNRAAEHNLALLETMYPQLRGAEVRHLAQRGGVVYKAHIMRQLMEIGQADAIYGDVFHALFGKNRAAHFAAAQTLQEPAYETVDTVLALAREAGAVTVLAHPSVYNSLELCAELAAQGRIDGVEIEHPRNAPEDQQALHLLAQQYGLLVTGGSDFHGMYMQKPVPLGAFVTSNEVLAQLESLHKTRCGAAEADDRKL